MSRVLVVYYSYSCGNTEKIAMKIAKAVNADICGINPRVPYPDDYETTVSEGKREVEEGIKREIQPISYDIKDYDTIVIGTPTWWYTMAPCVKTFLSENDFTGKIVIPFMTNAGWPGTVIEDMKKYLHGANVIHEKEILFDHGGGSEMVTSCKEVNAWINHLCI